MTKWGRQGPQTGSSMANSLLNLWRLAKAGVVLAQHGVSLVPKGQKVPLPLKLAKMATLPVRILAAPFNAGTPKERRISSALAALGPSYIKLGQFLATRGDIIGPEIAGRPAQFQDRMPPFSLEEARRAIEEQSASRS